jgi:hypothetical protein
MIDHRRYSRRYDKLPAVAGLERRHIENFLLEHFKNANWQESGISDSTAPDLRFNSSIDFWEKIIRERQTALNWVELTHFQMVDWFPRTPGLYHTPRARDARRIAEAFLTEENGILFYEPSGKAHMIEGGIGSVRFKPIPIEGEDCWLCTATTDGRCHSGIPLAIPNYLMRNVKLTSSHHYKIVGQVRFLPEFLERHFYHMSRVPQVYVFVDQLEKMGVGRGGSVEITPMVFFEGGRRMGLDTNENVTYVRCPANLPNALEQGVGWLEWYAERYDGEIITNFDQQQPVFQNAPFSLQKIMTGRIDRYQLNRYQIENAEFICDKIEKVHAEVATMSTIKVDFGDGNVFHGDVVVAEKIKNSFNKADKANIPDDLKTLLKDLAKDVGKMSELLPKEDAGEVARDLETLTAEATSANPRRRWWELSVEGLKKAAQDVGEIGIPVVQTATSIADILAELQ